MCSPLVCIPWFRFLNCCVCLTRWSATRISPRRSWSIIATLRASQWLLIAPWAPLTDPGQLSLTIKANEKWYCIYVLNNYFTTLLQSGFYLVKYYYTICQSPSYLFVCVACLYVTYFVMVLTDRSYLFLLILCFKSFILSLCCLENHFKANDPRLMFLSTYMQCLIQIKTFSELFPLSLVPMIVRKIMQFVSLVWLLDDIFKLQG